MTTECGQWTERFNQAMASLLASLGPSLVTRIAPELTAGQTFMLHCIDKEPGGTVSQLASKMQVSPSAATVMLGRLEHHGLVQRRRDQRDRRIVTVCLTAAGECALKRVLEQRAHIIQHYLSQLDPMDRQMLIEGMEKLASLCTLPHSNQLLAAMQQGKEAQPAIPLAPVGD